MESYSAIHESWSGVRLYSERDDKGLFSLFEEQPMRLSDFDLVYDRSPSFGSLLDLQAPHHFALVWGGESAVGGVCSMSWGPRLIAGEVKTLAYLGDLRVKPGIGNAKTWRNCYPELIGRSRSLPQFGVDCHLTAVLRSNNNAQLNLVTSKRQTVSYQYLSSQEMINVAFRKPWAKKLSSPYTFSWGGVTKEELLQFLDRYQRELLFGYDFPGSEWQRRINLWPHFSLENFLVARDGSGRLVFACAPWSPHSAKRMILRKMKLPLRAFSGFMNGVGISFPKNDGPLKVLYLTTLAFSPQLSEEEKRSLVAGAIEEVSEKSEFSDYHMISFADAWGLARAPSFKRRFHCENTTVDFFMVVGDGSTFPEEWKQKVVGFEMALT